MKGKGSTKSRNPESGKQNRNPESGIQKPESGIRNPETGIQKKLQDSAIRLYNNCLEIMSTKSHRNLIVSKARDRRFNYL